MLDRDKLIKMRSVIGGVVDKMETYILNHDDVEPDELMDMYIDLRNTKDVITEELFKNEHFN